MYVRDLKPSSEGCCVCGGARVVHHVLVHPDGDGSAVYPFTCEDCEAFGALATKGKAVDELRKVCEKVAGRLGIGIEFEEVETGS